MSNIFYDVLRGLNYFTGKDQYTQTRFPSVYYQHMIKGTDWIETGTNEQKIFLYQTTPQLRAVIDRKAMMKANGIWKHKRLNKAGEEEIIENSEYVYALENPNFLQSGNEFSIQKSIIFSIYGNSIQYVNKGTSGIPRMMWNLPIPETTFDRTGKLFKQVDINGVIERYTTRINGIEEIYDVNDIIHQREPNPSDPLKGLSKIEAAAMVLSNIRGAQGFRNRIINSNAMLGILSSEVSGANQMDPKPLDTDAQKRISEGLGMRFGMQEGKQDILQTEANVKWQAMSYPTKDLMLFEEVDEDFKMLIDMFGLNANIFSFSKQSTFENMEHGIRLAYRDTIIPEGESDALIYTKAFGLQDRGEWLELCYDHLDILKTDESEILLRKAQAVEIMLRSGVSAETVSEITGLELGTIKVMTPTALPVV